MASIKERTNIAINLCPHWIPCRSIAKTINRSMAGDDANNTPPRSLRVRGKYPPLQGSSIFTLLFTSAMRVLSAPGFRPNCHLFGMCSACYRGIIIHVAKVWILLLMILYENYFWITLHFCFIFIDGFGLMWTMINTQTHAK